MFKIPLSWRFQVESDQIEKIKACDCKALETFYFLNYEKIRALALSYCRKNGCYDLLEDCLNQVFVDLPQYDFLNDLNFYWCFRHSFSRACLLSRQTVVSLDAPVSSDNDDEMFTLGKCIGVDGFTELERKEDEQAVLKLIAAQSSLSDLARDQLTGFAFNCKVYRGLFRDEYSQVFATSN